MRKYERLNAEVVKFEAQDVITASVAAPSEPAGPVCECGKSSDYVGNEAHYRKHYIGKNADGTDKYCPLGTSGWHKCF